MTYDIEKLIYFLLQGRSVTLPRFFILTKNEYKNSLLTEFSSKLG